MTWGAVARPEYGVTTLTCYAPTPLYGQQEETACNAYREDTSCEVALPVLCLKETGEPRPSYPVQHSSGERAAFYRGWAGGHVGLTMSVVGYELTSPVSGDNLCVETFGLGYRMAEFHDGKFIYGMDEDNFFGDTWPDETQLSRGGWTFFAYGDVSEDTRFWVHINDQPANCWDELYEGG